MTNPFIEFVKKYQKDNNIKSYKEALKKASVEYKKKKGEDKKDTKKQADKVKELRKKQLEKKQPKAKVSAQAFTKREEKEQKIRKGAGEIITEITDKLKKGQIDDDTAKKSIAKARETAEEREKKLTQLKGLAKGLSGAGLEGGSLENTEATEKMGKAERNRKVKKFKKIQKELEKDIEEGVFNDKLIKEFKELAKELKGKSEKNIYARGMKKIEKGFNTQKFKKKKARVDKAQAKVKAVKEKQASTKPPPKPAVGNKAFEDAQSLMNKVAKRMGAELQQNAEDLQKGKIDEAQYLKFLKERKEELVRIEKKRRNILKSLKGLTLQEANKVMKANDASTGVDAIATAMDASIDASSGAVPTTAPVGTFKIITQTQRNLVNKIKQGVEKEGDLVSYLTSLSNSGNLTKTNWNNVARLKKIADATNDPDAKALFSQVEDKTFEAEKDRVKEEKQKGATFIQEIQSVPRITRGKLEGKREAPISKETAPLQFVKKKKGESQADFDTRKELANFRLGKESNVDYENRLKRNNPQNADESNEDYEERIELIKNQALSKKIFRREEAEKSKARPRADTEPVRALSRALKQVNRQHSSNLIGKINELNFLTRVVRPPVEADNTFKLDGKTYRMTETELDRVINQVKKETEKSLKDDSLDFYKEWENKVGLGEATIWEIKDDFPADLLDLYPSSIRRRIEKLIEEENPISYGVVKRLNLPFEFIEPYQSRAEPELEVVINENGDTSKWDNTGNFSTNFFGDVRTLDTYQPDTDDDRIADTIKHSKLPIKDVDKNDVKKLKTAVYEWATNNDGKLMYSEDELNTMIEELLEEDVEQLLKQIKSQEGLTKGEVRDLRRGIESGLVDIDIDPSEGAEKPVGGAGFGGENELIERDELNDEKGGALADKIHERIVKRNVKVDRVKKIDDKDNIFYKVSNSAYNKPKDRKDIGNYDVEDQYSNDENVVYVNDPRKEIIIGHRGSVNMKDLATDLRLAVSGIQPTNRYKRTLEMVEKVKSQYPNYKVLFTGHSLGGTIGIENARRFGDKAVVFNAGHTPFRRTNYKDEDITYYTNKGDPVSLMGSNSYKDVKLLDKGDKQGLVEAHSLTNFRPEKEEEEKDEKGGALPKNLQKIHNDLKTFKDSSLEDKLAKVKRMNRHIKKLKEGKHKEGLLTAVAKLQELI